MKNNIRYSHYFGLILMLSGMIIFGCSCGTSKPAPDPLAGWQMDFKEQPNNAIVNDYQNYIQQLSPAERQHARVSDWRKDDTGQHAIVIEVVSKPTVWGHVLIYDKNDKRIKIVKYIMYHYRS